MVMLSVCFLVYEGELFAHTAGGDFMPHVVTVHTGEVKKNSCLLFLFFRSEMFVYFRFSWKIWELLCGVLCRMWQERFILLCRRVQEGFVFCLPMVLFRMLLFVSLVLLEVSWHMRHDSCFHSFLLVLCFVLRRFDLFV